MSKPISKAVAKILEKPYSVRTNAGDWLYFSNKEDAHKVSKSCRWTYYVFLISSRSWIPVGIID